MDRMVRLGFVTVAGQAGCWTTCSLLRTDCKALTMFEMAYSGICSYMDRTLLTVLKQFVLCEAVDMCLGSMTGDCRQLETQSTDCMPKCETPIEKKGSGDCTQSGSIMKEVDDISAKTAQERKSLP